MLLWSQPTAGLPAATAASLWRRCASHNFTPLHHMHHLCLRHASMAESGTVCTTVCSVMRHGAAQETDIYILLLPTPLQVHGLLNGIGLGLMLPLAALIARTLREHPKVGSKRRLGDLVSTNMLVSIRLNCASGQCSSKFVVCRHGLMCIGYWPSQASLWAW
jgi:hypothetical protein